jgi:type VI secretion system Hcp family effector
VEEHFYTVRLGDAHVASVKQISEGTSARGEPAPPPMEEIEFAFQEIEWTYETGGVTYKDSRSGEHA